MIGCHAVATIGMHARCVAFHATTNCTYFPLSRGEKWGEGVKA